MSENNHFLSVPLIFGEQVRRCLLDLNLLDIDRRIVSENGRLFFPLQREIVVSEFFPDANHIDYSTGIMEFPSILSGPRTMRDALRGRLTEEELDLLPRAYDLIGDIAVLEIPTELNEYRHTIGEAFLQVRPSFTTILGKRGAIGGTIRTREYELLAGIDKTDTIHTEYGCKIAVDLSKAYFSPRLLEEHNRIAQLVHEGEQVVDMFTGVGPFALHIARKVRAKIVAVDINPDATQLLKNSITMNRLVGTIELVTADIREYSTKVDASFADRVIMNHPSGASDFIPEACQLLATDGLIHYYDFIGGDDPEETLSTKLVILVEKAGRKVKDVVLIRRVRDSAPYEYHMVIDAIIE